ncbi:gluconolaconase [Lysobacter sp. 5GHs7-4]|uniref:YVTN family beta-propeller repeat protein n=1 Tax=Lysobacter sp. 5GHs7-4 TaxID=2904253 RepID=UPI001E3AE739|nr:cytochrome D1 domain-containing protein [Lysobacter sp. 5GHs7-4]UHQ24751.1 gluconolaconase [Lysobacter sp. 5GHs7-4]
MTSLVLSAALPAGAAELLVGNKSADTVWRLSLEDGRKLGEFASGQAPHEIVVSPDGSTALVANYGGPTPGNTLSVLDLRGGAAPRVLDLGRHGRPHGLRFLPNGREAVVTTEASAQLLRVDLASGKRLAEIPLGEGRGHMVAVSADGKFAYVSKIDRGTVSRVDLGSGAKVAEVAAGAGAEGIALRPGADEVWVSNRAADTVTVHDARTLEVLATLPSAGFPIRVVFTADGRQALVSNARAGTLAVFDAAKRKPLATVALARKGVEYRDTLLGRAALPIGVIADPKRPRVYVAISGGDEVVVIDRKRWKVIAHWATGREPDALAIAP